MAFDIAVLGIPGYLKTFEPGPAAAKQRIAAINPTAYARTRNALDGAVTGLSPYLTHGIVSLQQAAQAVHSRQPLQFTDKLVFEFGWREFFHHVWGHQKNPDAILQDMHGTAPWHGRYSDVLPLDIREGRTGVKAIDNAVRILYATGYLHNHMRMWLASYVVHVRKVSWRAGADWLYAHLLDGDLPSNHLSWQWVASTFSSKPYLFNAENVMRYAPANARSAWDSSGSVVDQSYEALDILAREKGDAGAERGTHEKVNEPPLYSRDFSQVLESFMPVGEVDRAQAAINNIAHRNIELIHPWRLSAPTGNGALRLGVVHTPAHTAWPWSERRWRFVLGAMAEVTDGIWIGDMGRLDLSAASGVTAQTTLFPAYRDVLAKIATTTAAPTLLPNPSMACKSFSKFYERAQRGVGQFADLL